MKTMPSKLRRLVRTTRGANMVEYIILVGLVALICIGGYQLFGQKVSTKITNQGSSVEGVNDKPGT